MPNRDNQQPSYPVVEVALNAIADWVNKYRNTIGLANELGQCGPDESDADSKRPWSEPKSTP